MFVLTNRVFEVARSHRIDSRLPNAAPRLALRPFGLRSRHYCRHHNACTVATTADASPAADDEQSPPYYHWIGRLRLLSRPDRISSKLAQRCTPATIESKPKLHVISEMFYVVVLG